MAREINLFKNKKTGSGEFAKAREIIVRRVIPAFIIYAVFFLVSQSGSIFLDWQISSAEKKQANLESEILQYRTIEQMIGDVKSRIGNVQTIISQQAPFEDQILFLLEDLQTDGILFQSIVIDSDGEVKLDIRASNSIAVESFTDQVLEFDSIGKLSDAMLSAAVYQNSDGSYKMSVSFTLL